VALPPKPHEPKKIDDPPNLKKDRCNTKFGGIDRKTTT
jgi:hypothetical protein